MSKQLFVKMALDAWNAQVQQMNKLLTALSKEQLQEEIAPGRNRGIYLVGHLAAVNDKMLPLLGFGEQIHAEHSEVFLSKPDKAVSQLPDTAEIIKFWHDSVTTLTKHFDTLQADEWFNKHTSVSEADFAKEPHRNRLNVVFSRTGHLAYHIGQLTLLKK